MTHSLRERLLGYLLGALDDVEREQIEAALRTDPALQDELESLIDELAPLEELRDDVAPPDGLADRTLQLIDAHDEVVRVRRADAGRYEISSRSRWRAVDVVTMVGICVVAFLLFVPVLAKSRYAAQVTMCQDNLRELGMALLSYAERNDGSFPAIPESGNRSFAGLYAPILHASSSLEDSWLVCPGTQPATPIRLVTLDELDRAEGEVLIRLQRMSGGSYGYNLGARSNGRVVAPRNRSRASFALMADAPSPQFVGRGSRNHGGRGQNVLYEDGHVVFVVPDAFVVMLDHPFLNRHGAVAPGDDYDDAVVAESAVSLAPPDWRR